MKATRNIGSTPALFDLFKVRTNSSYVISLSKEFLLLNHLLLKMLTKYVTYVHNFNMER